MNYKNRFGKFKYRIFQRLLICMFIFLVVLSQTNHITSNEKSDQINENYTIDAIYDKYTEIGGLDNCQGSPIDIIVDNQYCYVLSELGSLYIFALMDFSDIQLIYQYNFSQACFSFCYSSNILYISMWSGIKALNINNRYSPVELWNLDLINYLSDICTDGDFLYGIQVNFGLSIINITDLTTPSILVQDFNDSGDEEQHQACAVKGDYLYIADGYVGLEIIDISNKASPIEVNEITLDWSFYIQLYNDIAIVKTSNTIEFINISNPLTATQINSYLGSSFYGNYNRGLYVEDDLLYIPSYSGYDIVDISNIMSPFEIREYSEVGYLTNLIRQDNYLLTIDYYDGLEILNVTNLSTPTEIFEYEIEGYAYSIFYEENYVYLNEHTGFSIIDISDPYSPIEIGDYDLYDELWSIAVNNDVAYLLTGNLLEIVNVSDPSNPIKIDTYSQYMRSMFIKDNYAYCSRSSKLLTILDISNPSSITFVGEFHESAPPHQCFSVYVEDNLAAIADGQNGVYILDVSNKMSIQKIAKYSENNCFIRDVYIKNNYLYFSDENLGFIVLDISDPSNPIKVGQYDETDYLTHDKMDIQNNFAYITQGDNFLILDVANATNPVFDGSYYDSGYYDDVIALDEYILLSNHVDGLEIVARDGDQDGLFDYREEEYNTDPTNEDTDQDNLLDGEEVYVYFTNPTKWDTDNDKYPDGFEITYGTDPNDASSYPAHLPPPPPPPKTLEDFMTLIITGSVILGVALFVSIPFVTVRRVKKIRFRELNSDIKQLETEGHFTCYYCGFPIDKGDELCAECSKTQLYCAICKLPINFGDGIGYCSVCYAHGHLRHYKSLEKIKAKCPVCKNKTTVVDIIPDEIDDKKK